MKMGRNASIKYYSAINELYYNKEEVAFRMHWLPVL